MKIGIQAVVCGLALGVSCLNAQEFVGSSPSGDAIRPLLQIPADAEADLIEWKLTLNHDPKPTYNLHCSYGQVVPNKPGLGKQIKTLDRKGHWTITKGTKANPQATVLELDGAVSFLQLDSNILHVLNADRSLMVGNGGWSYTLNRREASDKPGDPSSAPDMSYPISSLATGPTVCGVFESRSPCHSIAHELKLSQHRGCMKVKWRVTLYQNPETAAPTTYKVEGSLHRRAAREGNWSIIKDSNDPNATIYHLESTKTEAALWLLKGDDNVLFFLNQSRKPLVGHAEFSYTLNRRNPDPKTEARR